MTEKKNNTKYRIGISQKLIIPVILVSTVIYGSVIGVATLKMYEKSKNDKQDLIIAKSGEFANYIAGEFKSEITTTRNMAISFEIAGTIDSANIKNFDKAILAETIKKNQNLLSVWINRQLFDLDKNHTSKYGRYRQIAFFDKENNKLITKDSLIPEPLGVNTPGQYNAIRQSGKEKLVEPYTSDMKQTGEQILMTSMCVPIKKNSEFVGMAGIDFSLERIQRLVSGMSFEKNEKISIISNEGVFIFHFDSLNTGKKFTEIFEDQQKKYSVVQHIKNGSNYYYFYYDSINNDEKFICYSAINFGDKTGPWALQTVVSATEMYKEAKQSIYILIIFAVVGLVLIISISISVMRIFLKPVLQSNIFVKKMAQGDLTVHFHYKGNDEIGELIANLEEMKEHWKTLIKSFKNTAQLVKSTITTINTGIEKIEITTDDQSESSIKLTQAMKNISENIANNSEFAGRTSYIARKANVKLNMAVKKLESAKDNLVEIEENITLLEDLAFQTKMISLNSAIEAAHAGEAGKGFAIVAKNVRRLADKTKKLSDKVRLLSNSSIQRSDSSAVMIAGIEPEISNISVMIEKVADQISRQNLNSKEVETSMQKLDKTIQDSKEFAKTMTTNSKNLEIASDELLNAIATFKV